MNIKMERSFSELYRKICILMIWITVLYSTVIQQKFFHIPYGMIILGIIILLSFSLVLNDIDISPTIIMTREFSGFIIFMIYMLVIGIIKSPSISNHISQWITSLEYMFIMVVISSIIISSGTDMFHYMLLFEALVLSVIFLIDPVLYSAGRYSISLDMNPNGLGMFFTSGIWALLYGVQKRKIPIVLALILVSLFTYCILYTGSRKAFIAAWLVIILWTLVCFIPDLKDSSIENKIFLLSVLVIFIFIVFTFFSNIYSSFAISERMDSLIHGVTENDRAELYKEGFILFKKSPILGIGFQGFKYYYDTYTHTTLVEIPISGGIIGAFLYFVPYFISIKKCIRLYSLTKKSSRYSSQNNSVKFLLILWVVMLFYCTCIIHHYQFESFVIFGIIFGQSSYLEKDIIDSFDANNGYQKKYKYLKE